MKKPDRFERIVLKLTYPDMCVDKDDAIALLRKEHRWVERMVQSHLALWSKFPPRGEEADKYGRDCRAAQCREILSALKQRRK